MKQEDILDWMLEQGIVEDINVAKEFASAITQEQLDSFGDAPILVVGCMWEGWKLAKKQYNKPLNHTATARVVKDLNIDGYSLEAYGISVGDRVYIRDWDELSKTFEVSKDGVEWIVAELEELEFS